MLSIVLYGRNDSYGYNLHKRAALGLNCMAELLADPEDEIIFVDYNTPDDFPTFPEAIADTLTPKVLERLRVLRVRPSVHERYKSRTHLNALEPVARNVAVRRSNPSNRWILSTNTDMIFISRRHESLSRIAAGLDQGYYHLPRFELPESLWEGFDRLDPVAVIRQVEEYGRSMFLNDVVYNIEDCLKYDAPGDFQLIRRDDLFAIDGFNEEMLLGWHVDWNIARRLHLLHYKVGDASDALLGYHCDHIRQVTPAHEQQAPSNDVRRFCVDVASPYLPDQHQSWGCPTDAVEEIHLSRSVHRTYRDLLTDEHVYDEAGPARSISSRPDMPVPPPYDARHVLPFLVDSFASQPRGMTIAWLGGRVDMLTAFCRAWERLGFTGRILLERWSQLFLPTALPACTRVVECDEIDRADLFVFDFGAPSVAIAAGRAGDDATVDALFEEFIRNSFVRLANGEAGRDASLSPRRFICIDAVSNQYQDMVHRYVGAASAPFSIRLRQGFVRRPAGTGAPTWEWPAPQLALESTHRIDLLPLLASGEGGMRAEAGIVAPYGRRGYVCRGPFQRLPIGHYRVEFTVSPRSPMTIAGAIRPIVLDVVAGADRLALSEERFLLRRKIGLNFSISPAAVQKSVELRIFRGRHIDFVVTAAELTRVAPAVAQLKAVLPGEERSLRPLAFGTASL